MNGPGYLMLGLVIPVGVFMLASWRARARRRPLQLTAQQWAIRITALVLWLAAVVIVPTFARPGPQHGLGLVVDLLFAPALMIGVLDCRAWKSAAATPVHDGERSAHR